MNGQDASFLDLLDESSQFAVPIFQRRYSWEEKHCEKLWNDILRLGKNGGSQSHFLGSIVYIGSEDDSASKVHEYEVIDGQQRLTTLTLLLAALSRAVEEQGVEIGITSEEISDYYLNVRRKDILRYKQLLTQHDKDTLIKLLDGNDIHWFDVKKVEGRTQIHLLEDDELPPNAVPRLIENYRFFQNKLKTEDLKSVYIGIKNLKIIDVVLNPNSDDPQLIFESLNSTGRELSQTDLIRNYVLMGQKRDLQDRLYEVFWHPMEKLFGDQYANRFDDFIRDYLTLKTRDIPKINEVYDNFKTYIQEREKSEKLGTIEPIIEEIFRFSKYYVSIVLGLEKDIELRNLFSDIDKLDVTVAYPFLLEVYDDYKHEYITKIELVEILKLVESYVFRRMICDIPTNSLNATFAVRLIPNVNKNTYLESLKQVFLDLIEMSDRYRFPSDSEFKQEFMVKGVYNNLKRCKYLLRKLENHKNKQPIHHIDDYTVEHIMPQNNNLSEEWQEELGDNWQEIQEQYLHTIGNLTLTGYNSELSDKSFCKKKEHKPGGFRDGGLRLNVNLLNVLRWNEYAIQARAKGLAEKALKIWTYPKLTDL